NDQAVRFVMRFRQIIMVALVGLVVGALGQAADPVPASVTIAPALIELRQHRQPHSIQVLGTTADGYSLDLRPLARFTSANPSVAAVGDDGWVRPVANGETVVTVTTAGQMRTVAVKVQLPATEPSISFRHEVMPVFSRAGCNQGACHGYSLGKNGFKLSLRGGGEAADYLSLTQEFLGRRINRQHPEASLLLRKPLGEVAHRGGVRIEAGDLLHETLLNWIRDGAPSDLADPVRLTSIRIFPEKIIAGPGEQQQLQLEALYSDGSVRDVTRLGVFTSNADSTVAVDESGLVRARELGETAVVARFERIFAVSNVMVLGQPQPFTP